MFKVHTDQKDFDLGIEDFGTSEGQDIHIYVLEEGMSALSLMEAFRACRYNPLRTYYFIPKTDSNFSSYAIESISRGTVNIFSDIEELRDSLRSEAEAWRSHSIPECIQKSAANFKVMVNREAVTALSVGVTTELNKNSCYTVAVALMRLFQSGEPLRLAQFQSHLGQALENCSQAQKANAAFAEYHSHFLSTLVANGKEINPSWHTEEYDGMALHVMFQPFSPETKSINNRVKIISQLTKEKRGNGPL